MRIVHVITSLDNGGAEGVLFRLCSSSKFTSHSVVSLTSLGEYGRQLSDLGYKVFALNMERGKISFRALIQMVQIMRFLKPDIVQTWMYHADFLGSLVARFVGIRRIFWNVRNSNLKTSRATYKTVILVKFLAMLSHIVPFRIIVCSKIAEQIHINHGFNKEKFFYIPNGCDLKIFKNSSLNNQHSLNWKKTNSTVTLGMIARWHDQKNHVGLLQALSIIKQRGFKFNCILAGQGIDTENYLLINLIEKMDLNGYITLLGPIKDVPCILKRLDFHILSSTYGEASPNAVIEAMACGIPCIATDVGDTKNIIGETGWVVSPGDILGLADAVDDAIRTLSISDEYMVRSIAARNRIENNFSLDEMVKAYEMIWSESMKI